MAVYNIANSTLQDGNKTLYEMSMQHTGSLYSAPWDIQVSRGKVPGVTQVNVFGYGNAVSNSVYASLWEDGAYTFPASASYMNVYSSSTSDDSNSQVLITGLDANWNLQTETVTLNGTSNVATTKQWLRINSFQMTKPGTGQDTNIGTITMKNAANAAIMYPGVARMQNSWYSIANGYSLYVSNINIFTGEAKSGASPTWFYYRVRNHNNVSNVHYNVLTTSFQNEYKVQRNNPVRYTAKSDIEWQFKSSESGPFSMGIILEGLLISDTAP